MLKEILIKLAGNHSTQKLLQKNIHISQYLMGIGSGWDANSSAEGAVLKFLDRKPGHLCIFDVGANKGQYLNMLIGKLSQKDFEIHSFEPSSFTFENLKKNVPQKSNIKLNNLALGKEESELILYYDKPGSGLASLTKRKLEHFNINFDKSEKVIVCTIDKYCAENNINHINLLKLDVEGHEMGVLEGGRQMFSKSAVDVVTFEFGGCNIDTRYFFQDFFYFFREQAMLLYRITPSGYLFPIEKYKEEYEQFITTNFVAVKESN